MDCNLYDSVDNCGNINNTWDAWSFKVNKVMNRHAPLKTNRVKSRSSPWITRDIKSLMYRCDHIHKKAKRTRNNELIKEYKILHNKVVDEIRKAKQNYFSGEICNNTNSKKMWRAIGTLLNTRKTAVEHGISAETINTYFTNIGSDLTKTLTDDVTLHWSIPDSNYRFKIHQISEDEVYKNLSKLSTISMQDVLGFDSKLLPSSVPSLFNKSLHTHQLPAVNTTIISNIKILILSGIRPLGAKQGQHTPAKAAQKIAPHHIVKLNTRALENSDEILVGVRFGHHTVYLLIPLLIMLYHYTKKFHGCHMGYDLSVPRSDVLCNAASSDIHRAAFGAINEHVAVAGSVTYFTHCLLQSWIVNGCRLTTRCNCNIVHELPAIRLQLSYAVNHGQAYNWANLSTLRYSTRDVIPV